MGRSGKIRTDVYTELHMLYRLSRRESSILMLIGFGKTSKEIATELALSIQTIGSYRKNLCRKLNVNSTAELVAYAARLHAGADGFSSPIGDPPR